MISLIFLGRAVLTICLYVVILRLWMQQARVNFYNPFTQFIVRITQPVIGPLRRLIPSIGRIDTATWLVFYLIALLKVMFIYRFEGIDAPIWSPYYLLFALAAMVHAFGHLLFWLLFFRAILSWISRGQSVADELLAQLTEPLVAPIRRVIPPIGMIDLSFMVVVFILMFLNLLAIDFLGNLWLAF